MRKFAVPVIVAAVALLLACAPAEEEAPAAELRSVRFTVVEETTVSESRRFSGVMAATDELPIAFRVAGQVLQVQPTTGDRVQAGQVLARLESGEFELEVERAEAAVESSRSQAETAQAQYARTRELFRNDSASRTQLESARSNQEAAEANLVSSEAQLERAQLQLSYTEIRAPFSGSVAVRYVDPGTVVGAGQAILGLSGENVERVRISVPEDVVARIREGMIVSVSVDAAGLNGVAGEIVEISSGSAEQGTLFPVEVALRSGRTSQLRTGMAASVEINLSTGRNVGFVVPANVVLEDESGRHVFVVTPNVGTSPPTGVIERRPVEVGDLTDDGLEILSGLGAGDRVVTAGMSLLRDGMAVRSPE